jgi:DNA helicase-2/ATP-dependent DNA helicase PcrA
MHLKDLNEQQKIAVTHIDGPLLVLAGAGAGKTRVITHRIVHLTKNGVAPHNILAVTFTNKAAREMRERVLRLLDTDPDINRPVSARLPSRRGRARDTGLSAPFVSTFHALGASILRENARVLGLKRHFAIFDRADCTRAIKQAIKRLGLDPKQFEPRIVLSVISKQKGDGIGAEAYSPGAGDTWRNTVHLIWKEYEEILKRESALDFDDLLLKTLELLHNHGDVLKKYQDRWTHIHIDEYQDTNKVQFAIAELLVGKRSNICVVGDIDQMIYSWRGAHLENLLLFEDEFPNTTTVVLEENYRSTKTILEAANAVIAKNVKRKEKNLFTRNAEGEPVSVYSAYNEEDEARFVVERAGELIDANVSPKNIAALYRANFQSRALEQAFMYAGIPYQVLGTRFFERKEVKDVLSYVRAALNPDSRGDIARVVSAPPRGIGKMTLAKMLDGKEKELTPATQKKVSEFKNLLARIHKVALSSTASQTIRMVAQESGLEKVLSHGTDEDKDRLENIKELVTFAAKYDYLPPQEAIEKLLEDAALATDQDSLDNPHPSAHLPAGGEGGGGTDVVKLMTVHASKGLEFDYVFITGLEEGLFPHVRLDEDADEEEERRLFYVALTRARKKVFLTHAVVRTIYGSQDLQQSSQFIEDIDEKHLVSENETELPHDRKVDLIDF